MPDSSTAGFETCSGCRSSRSTSTPWPGLVFVTVLHTFPFVYLLAVSALQSVDASMEESARILGAGRWRTARRRHPPAGRSGGPGRGAWWPSSTRSPSSARRRSSGCLGESSRCRRRIYALLRPPAALRPGVRAVADLRRDHGRGAGAPAPVPGPAVVRHPRRQGPPAADRPARPGSLGRSRSASGSSSWPCSPPTSRCSRSR